MMMIVGILFLSTAGLGLDPLVRIVTYRRDSHSPSATASCTASAARNRPSESSRVAFPVVHTSVCPPPAGTHHVLFFGGSLTLIIIIFGRECAI